MTFNIKNLVFIRDKSKNFSIGNKENSSVLGSFRV